MPLPSATLLPGSVQLFWVLLFILGTLVGSFLNVCIYRLPHGLSITRPPSHCPRCDRRLAMRDLLPLVSQVLLRARCRYCGAPISWRYFGIEFLTGVLFVLAGSGWWAGPIGISSWNGDVVGNGAKLLQGLVFMSTLVVIFWVDYDTRLIPLEAAFLLGLAGVARDAWETARGVATPTTGLTSGGLWPGQQILPAPLPGSLWAMVAAASILWGLRALFSWLYGREALGFGDVVLVGAIAANLGWNGTLWTFAFASTVLGAIVGLLLQMPRAIRARRWALRRAHKYLQRAQAAQEIGEPPQQAAAEEAQPQVLAAEPPSSPAVLEPMSAEPLLAEPMPGKLEVPLAEPLLAELHRERAWAQQRARYWRKVAPLLIRHSLRKGMPFGPMLAIGAVAALLWGASLNRSYLSAVNPEASAPGFDTPSPAPR